MIKLSLIVVVLNSCIAIFCKGILMPINHIKHLETVPGKKVMRNWEYIMGGAKRIVQACKNLC